MIAISLRTFGGLNTAKAARLLQPHEAQVAHNCLLWDGTLRPLAEWVNAHVSATDQKSIKLADNDTTYLLSPLGDAVKLDPLTHPEDTVVGLTSTRILGGQSNIGYQTKSSPIVHEVGVAPPELSLSCVVQYTRQHQSEKAVNRLYGFTAVRRTDGYVEESALSVVPNQNPDGVIYEGDMANINVIVTGGGFHERTGYRLYRTTTALSTGHSGAAPLRTEWHLIAELSHAYDVPGQTRAYKFYDSGAGTVWPMDTFYAHRFYPPQPVLWDFLALTESGWVVAAQKSGQIMISERGLPHAWPTENYRNLPYDITAIATHYDTAYIGTPERVYMMAISSTEDAAVQATPRLYPVQYGCLPRSLAEMTFGALYATQAGLVSLTPNGAKLISANFASSLYPLYTSKYETTVHDVTTTYPIELRFADTTYATSFNGQYFAFCDIPHSHNDEVSHLGYLVTLDDNINADRPLQHLITMDVPNGTVLDSCRSSFGLALLTTAPMPVGGDPDTIYNNVWAMPFPDSKDATQYKNAKKFCYTWRSKVFAFTEYLAMACAQVIHEAGFVRLSIFVDGCCSYEVKVCGSQPFPLPLNLVGHTFEIELSGTAIIHEVHIATSIEDLPDGRA